MPSRHTDKAILSSSLGSSPFLSLLLLLLSFHAHTTRQADKETSPSSPFLYAPPLLTPFAALLSCSLSLSLSLSLLITHCLHANHVCQDPLPLPHSLFPLSSPPITQPSLPSPPLLPPPLPLCEMSDGKSSWMSSGMTLCFFMKLGWGATTWFLYKVHPCGWHSPLLSRSF